MPRMFGQERNEKGEQRTFVGFAAFFVRLQEAPDHLEMLLTLRCLALPQSLSNIHAAYPQMPPLQKQHTKKAPDYSGAFKQTFTY
jgi:hypothetical protein